MDTIKYKLISRIQIGIGIFIFILFYFLGYSKQYFDYIANNTDTSIT